MKIYPNDFAFLISEDSLESNYHNVPIYAVI